MRHMRQHEWLQLIATLHRLKPPGPCNGNEAEIGARPGRAPLFILWYPERTLRRQKKPLSRSKGALMPPHQLLPARSRSLLMRRAKHAFFFLDLIAKMSKHQHISEAKARRSSTIVGKLLGP
jgi:hypothetical protein